MSEQRIGAVVESIQAARPSPITLTGRYVTLAPLDPAAHADSLYDELGNRADLWLYLFDPSPPDHEVFRRTIEAKAAAADRFYFALVDPASAAARGWASYLRFDPVHRSIEVGDILFGPALQRTRAATEAMYLMAKHAFETLGYRRYEWKCNALNEPSMRAAHRLGFTYEGTFRQHMIVKGRNRDTAWFSMLDRDWPARQAAFERYLDPENFDAAGRQLRPLERSSGAAGAGQL
jgi:RimJ/RimL family protein N-acetyltransferase